MVGIVVVSHSARLAEGVVELAREMAADVRLEPAGGLEPPSAGEPAPLGTDAARVMAAVEAADDGSGDGVVVLMDLGSAVLSAEMAVELLEPEAGERVRLCPAPLAEGAVAAAVAAQAGGSADDVCAEASAGLAAKQSHLGAPEPADGELRQSAYRSGRQIDAGRGAALEERFAVTVAQGLHARPAAQFVRAAAAADAQIEVENATTGAGPAPATSLNGIATLGVREGHEIVVRAHGPEAQQAIDALRRVATGGAAAPTAPAPGPAAPEAGAPSGGAGEGAAPGAATPTASAPGPAAPEAGAPSGALGAPPSPQPPFAEGAPPAKPTAATGSGEAEGAPPAEPTAATGSGEAEGAPPAEPTAATGSGEAEGAAPPRGPEPATLGRHAAPPARPLPPGAPAGALAGIPSSPGIAIAPLRRLGAAGPAEAEPPIAEEPAGGPDEEWAALERARSAVRADVEARRERLAAQVGAEEAEILDALALMLDDDALLGPARAAIDERSASAARAWADAVEAVAARYRALEDPYQRERAGDLADLGRRVLAALARERAGGGQDSGATGGTAGASGASGTGGPAGGAAGASGATGAIGAGGAAGASGAAGPASAASGASDAAAAGDRPGPAILLARELTPLDAAAIDPAEVKGIATALGGPTSHGAILARALGVPAVVGVGEPLLDLPDGSRAILDGAAGLLVPDPAPELERAYRERAAREAAAAEQARAAADQPAFTRDETRIEVAANAADADDAAAAVAAGADGIGLLRTEFAFLGRPAMPDEDEQTALYDAAATALGGRPLVIRTLDAGADKPLPYLAMPAEENPFLGVRGLRLGLARRELLRTQLRAIVRTATAHENVKVMFPMVATVDEVRTARRMVDEACAYVGGSPRDGFEVGIMVEVPAAALLSVQLAHVVDFFSLGTNDLTQYTLAAERGNAALAQLADGLHPALLRLVHEVCHAARANGRWVGVCGELAADPVAVPLLVGLGVRELSVAAPSVAAVKATVRQLDLEDAAALAHAALAADSAAAVRDLVVSDRDLPGNA